MQTKSSMHLRCDEDSAVTHERSSANNAPIVWASVLQVLVDSGHLGVQEVTRLAQVSRGLQQVTADDNIWASLCLQHWPGTRHIPKRSAEASGHRTLYRQWCHPRLVQESRSIHTTRDSPDDPVVKCRPKGLGRLYRLCSCFRPKTLDRFFTRQRSGLIPMKQPPPLGPPNCSTDEIQLHVLVKYKGVVILCKCIQGKEMEHFCTTGSLYCFVPHPSTTQLREDQESSKDEMELDQKSSSGDESELDYDSMYLESMCPNDFILENWDVRIHYYRTTDSTMACLLSSDTSPRDTDSLASLSNRHEAKEDIVAYANFRATDVVGLQLRNTKQAADIRDRLVPTIIILKCCASFKRDMIGDYGMTSLSLQVVKMNVPDGVGDWIEEYFQPAEEEKEHGVTLLHILSELQCVC